MTPKEARAELMLRFPNQSVSATMDCWYYNHRAETEERYSISYNFQQNSCSQKNASSFEDCFVQLDEENAEINEAMAKYSILLRQF